MKQKKKKIRIVILIILVFSCFFALNYKTTHKTAYALENSQAKALCLIESNTGRKLYCNNENTKLPMASTTKIITALTVLNNCNNIDEEFMIDSRAVGITGTSIYLKKDEKMTVRELLYGMMLPSGNDAATALAYKISGDIPSFCKLMQQTANKCGAYNSSFENPHGLDAPKHYTTAHDLALITACALNNEIFKEIVTTKNTRIRGSSEGTYRYLKNKNRLLNTLDGCIGVKTGFTNKAGRCLVSACERDNFTTVCVVLNCGPMFEESADFINKAYNEYNNTKIVQKDTILSTISVNNGEYSSVGLKVINDIHYPLKENELNNVVIKLNVPKELNAPVKKDEIVGNLEVYLNKHLLFSEKIYTINSIKKIGVKNNLKEIISMW